MPLNMDDLVQGEGAMALGGKQVTVHYTGWLFDASAPETKGREVRQLPRPRRALRLPARRRTVIAGWDRGVAGMRIGGQRRLTIPPEMGYGARGAGGVIPPNATLVFDVELLGVE